MAVGLDERGVLLFGDPFEGGVTWPDLPTFVEIEGPDEAAVRRAAALFGFDYSEARFGSVDEIYKSEMGRDILAEPTLLFSETDKNEQSAVTVTGD